MRSHDDAPPIDLSRVPTALFSNHGRRDWTMFALSFDARRCSTLMDVLLTADRLASDYRDFDTISFDAGQLGLIEEITDASALTSPLGERGASLADHIKEDGGVRLIAGDALYPGLYGFVDEGRGTLDVGARTLRLRVDNNRSIGKISTYMLATALLGEIPDNVLDNSWRWFAEHAPRTLLDAAGGSLDLFGGTLPPRPIPEDAVPLLLEHPSRTVREHAIRTLRQTREDVGRAP